MVGNTGTLMTMRIVRSKFRKRDETSETAVARVTVEAQQSHDQQSRSTLSDNQHQQIFTATGVTNNGSINNSMELETISFARTSGSCGTTNTWVFPPKAPSPNLYNCYNHESVVASGERNGFKGLKKHFSGRFKRLVSKKETSSPIPPELKPQLKTIYVY